MINEGVKVLMIVNLDSDSGAACLKKAAAAGIVSIDYDRLTLGGGASYYVSFDNVEVGKLMGAGLEKCLTDMGKTKANIIYIDGAATDNNAALFKQGYEEALKPKIDSGDYKLVGDVSGEWNDQKAANAFDGLYTKNNGKIDGIVSANDTMAGGIIARLKRQPRRQGPGHRSGRLDRGPAADPRGHAVHDRLQEHQPRGGPRLEAGDRRHQGRHGRGRRARRPRP